MDIKDACGPRPPQWFSKSRTSSLSITWNLIEMPVFRLQPRPIASEILGVGPSKLWFNKPSKWYIEKSEYIPLTTTELNSWRCRKQTRYTLNPNNWSTKAGTVFVGLPPPRDVSDLNTSTEAKCKYKIKFKVIRFYIWKHLRINNKGADVYLGKSLF